MTQPTRGLRLREQSTSVALQTIMATTDPHSFSDTSQGRIQHVDFDLDLDFASKTIRGRAIYTLESPVPGPLFLDVRDVAQVLSRQLFLA